MEWVVGIQVDADSLIYYVHMDDLKRCAPPDPTPNWPEVARGTSIVLSTRAPSTAAQTITDPPPTGSDRPPMSISDQSMQSNNGGDGEVRSPPITIHTENSSTDTGAPSKTDENCILSKNSKCNIDTHTQIHLCYARPLVQPCSLTGTYTWHAQSTETPGVGTRSETRQAEAAATQAQATRALWPEKPDKSLLITRMTRDLRLQDPPEDNFRETQRRVPAFKFDENQNEVRPPAASIHSHHRDVFIIPPPRAGGGAVGALTPVSTVPLGLIHHVDSLLVTQLREDPASLAVRDTRLRVLSTMRLVRTCLVGQLAALQQWEEAMHYQGGQ